MYPGVEKRDFNEDKVIEVANQNLKKKLNRVEQGIEHFNRQYIISLKSLSIFHYLFVSV